MEHLRGFRRSEMFIAFAICSALTLGTLSVLLRLARSDFASTSRPRQMSCPSLEALPTPPSVCQLLRFDPLLDRGKRITSSNGRFTISLDFESVFPAGAQKFPSALGSGAPLTPLELSTVEYERGNPADISFEGSSLHFLPEILRGRAEILDGLRKEAVPQAYLCCCDPGSIDSRCSVRSADNAAIYSFWADRAFVTSGYSLKKKFRK